jgi:hypothetical protein
MITTAISVPRANAVTINLVMVPEGPLPANTMFTVSRQPNSATKLIEPKAVTSNPTGGTVLLTAEDTDLAPGEYAWDAKCTDAPETTAGQGTFTITATSYDPVAA